MSEKRKRKPRTPEQREKGRERDRRRYWALTPEQREKKRERDRAWRPRTPEQREKKRAKKQRWYIKNHTKILEQKRLYWVTNKEKLLAKKRRHYAENRETYLHGFRQRNAMVGGYAAPTGNEAAAYRKHQGTRCAICGVAFVYGKWFRGEMLDHCHRTGQTRGLLCGACNLGLGLVESTATSDAAARQILFRMAHYRLGLEEFPRPPSESLRVENGDDNGKGPAPEEPGRAVWEAV